MNKSRNTYSPDSRMGSDEIQSPAALREKRFGHSEIASRAYERWQRKGRPDGSAEDDWFQAERELESAETATQP